MAGRLSAPRQMPVHVSLTRPILLGGAERELVIVEVTTIVALSIGVGFHFLTLVMAVVLGTMGHNLLRYAASNDPQMLCVYSRHVRYLRFYPAQAHPNASLAPVLPFNFGI